MRVLNDIEFNDYFILKQKAFIELDYSTIDSGMVPILKTLAKQSEIVPLFSCEGHLEDLDKDSLEDSYITFTCKDPTLVINLFHELLLAYSDVEYQLRPTLDYSLLCKVLADDSWIQYPAYTFRVWLNTNEDKDMWLANLNKLYSNIPSNGEGGSRKQNKRSFFNGTKCN